MTTFIRIAALLATFALPLTNAAHAAGWQPPGPLRVEIGFGAGGSTDTLGRVVAATIAEQTGWTVIAENKPGGGGVAMFTGVAKAPADGSVVGLGVNMPVLINLVTRGDKLPFKVDSFDYLGTVARAQLALIARKEAPFDDIAGLVAYSKSQGGAAVAFDAKPQELIMRRIDDQTGAGFRLVSTKSGAEIIKLLLGEQVVAGFNAGAHLPYIEKGTLKVIASANEARHDYAPQAATVREQGFPVHVDPIFYFAAPRGLDPQAREALAGAIDAALRTDKVADAVDKALSSQVMNLGPEGTEKMMVQGMDNVRVLFGK